MNPPSQTSTKNKTKSAATSSPTQLTKTGDTLRSSTERAIATFFSQLDGETCTDLYALVLEQVEQPLLAAVLDYTQGNQSKAAEMLGLNRGTLRTKLRQHGLMTTPPSKQARRRKHPTTRKTS